MKSSNGRFALKGLAVFAGVAAAVGLPTACSGSDKKTSGGGGNGGNAGDASSQGGTGLIIIGNGGNGTGSADGGGGIGGGCAVRGVEAGSQPVNILLVVDRSGSMTATPTGFTTSKWDAMKTALHDAVAATQASINYGLELFPNTIANPTTEQELCDMGTAPGIAVPIQQVTDGGSNTLAAIDAALLGGPSGNTPTAAALARALTYFTTGGGASLMGEKYILLATDGGPNCNSSIASCTAGTCTLNMDGVSCGSDAGAPVDCCSVSTNLRCLDDQATTTAITNLANAGIRTIVVGIPGTEQYSTYLDAFALAGGAPASLVSPNYYAVSASGGTQGLTDVLTNVTKQLVTSCTQELRNLPVDADLSKIDVHVDFGSGPVQIPRRLPDAGLDGGTEGWSLIQQQVFADGAVIPDTVVLLGATCAKVQTLGAESVSVTLACTEIPPQ